MVNPARADAAVDLAYGALIVLSVVLIAVLDTNVGIAFGVGVFASYVIHVVWKMARFDPDWMTTTVQETVEETVGDTVETKVGDTVETKVGETVEEAVERSVEEQLGEVQSQVEAVDERVDRRPREDEVEELLEDSAEADPAERTDDG